MQYQLTLLEAILGIPEVRSVSKDMEAKLEAIFSTSEHRHDGYQMKACDKRMAINIVLGHFGMLFRS